MTSAITAGIHGIGIDPARVRAFVNLVNPRGLLVLGNPGIALEYAADRLVIYRHWPNEFASGDDGLFEKLPAVDYLKRCGLSAVFVQGTNSCSSLTTWQSRQSHSRS